MAAQCKTEKQCNSTCGGAPEHLSMFEKMKYVQKNEESGGKAAWYQTNICLDSIGTLIGTIVYSAVSIACIVIGAIYLNDCPIQPMIPKSLIVAGSLFTGTAIYVSICKFVNRRRVQAGKPECTGYRGFESAIRINAVIWFFICAGFTYHNHKKYQSDFPAVEATYCNGTLYLFSFWWCTVSFILMAVCIFLCCTCCVCMCCCAGKAAANAEQEENQKY